MYLVQMRLKYLHCVLHIDCVSSNSTISLETGSSKRVIAYFETTPMHCSYRIIMCDDSTHSICEYMIENGSFFSNLVKRMCALRADDDIAKVKLNMQLCGKQTHKHRFYIHDRAIQWSGGRDVRAKPNQAAAPWLNLGWCFAPPHLF